MIITAVIILIKISDLLNSPSRGAAGSSQGGQGGPGGPGQGGPGGPRPGGNPVHTVNHDTNRRDTRDDRSASPNTQPAPTRTRSPIRPADTHNTNTTDYSNNMPTNTVTPVGLAGSARPSNTYNYNTRNSDHARFADDCLVRAKAIITERQSARPTGRINNKVTLSDLDIQFNSVEHRALKE